MKIDELLDSQLSEWKLAKDNYEALSSVKTREITFDGFNVKIQFNPERVRSTCAGTPHHQMKQYVGCFLCEGNRPSEQKGVPFENDFTILCNPYPVFSRHLTIASNIHKPQSIIGNLPAMLKLAKELPDFVIFYNGPECGASAPMHLHFQAGIKQEFPLYNDFPILRNNFAIPYQPGLQLSKIKDSLRIFYILEGNDLNVLDKTFNLFFCNEDKEPNLNILLWFENNQWTVCVFKRKQHRPSQFYAEGTQQILISPAAVEMAGLFVTPRPEDFEKTSKEDLMSICEQVNGE